MKIKRFEAGSMREALRLVRDEQGPDAVILSNRRTANGVEVVAAVDYDAALMQQGLRHAQVQSPLPAAPQNESAPAPFARVHDPRAPLAPRIDEAPKPAKSVTTPVRDELQQARATIAAKAAAIRKRRGAAVLAKKKLSSAQPAPVPRLVAPQLAPAPVVRAAPVPMAAHQRDAAQQMLMQFGLDRALINEILQQMPADTQAERARFLPLALLARRIAVPEDEALMSGGIYALLGPTGAGKTTTLAKLAARYIAQHSARDVAIVSTDHYRIGAQEQLYTYGRLLGLPVHSAANAEELKSTLLRLAGKKLVLIDTAGMSARDTKLAGQFAALTGSGVPIKPLLVLAANSAPHDLDLVVQRFSAIHPHACVLTKLDESTRLGGALSVVIRRQLPVAYTANGQRVPEDLALARADRLVLSAAQLARAAAPAPIKKISNGAVHAAH
ncbi:MAG TPA: flagellar biosynthesis protein FlhF [Nevskiaceae bacterium]|nr:flagellar biosynthesis protein FlhF [Nevskiaceae bacterium]